MGHPGQLRCFGSSNRVDLVAIFQALSETEKPISKSSKLGIPPTLAARASFFDIITDDNIKKGEKKLSLILRRR